MKEPKEAINDFYKANQLVCEDEIKKYDQLINTYSFYRLFWLLAGLVLFYQSFKFGMPLLTGFVSLFVIIIFGWLVKQQTLYGEKKNYFINLKKVNTNELKSIDDHDNIYPDGSVWSDGLHPYSSDLDIFGKGSLFNLINRCSTVQGNTKLAGWLKTPASVTDIRQRQEAVAELAAKPEWKLHFQALLLFANNPAEDHSGRVIQYMNSAIEERSAWLKMYVRYIPWIFITVFIAAFYFHYLFLLALVIGAFNYMFYFSYTARIFRATELIGKAGRSLSLFSVAISGIKEERWESKLGSELAAYFKDGQHGRFSQEIKRLSVLINNLSLPAVISQVLNIIMIWDIRYVLLLEDWKRNNKTNLEQAFDIIASFEALVSISSLKINYPDWVFPIIEEHQQYTLNAKSIGHPLIAKETRVNNNFSLTNELKIDIITGSNMAGKSTFLRTLGINTVLALSGSPVCAQEMSITPMLVFSYMRISDSLNESTSTFKAELDRLRSLLEILERSGKVYFLIDEMLRGTNSVDKYLGSKAIIEKLISQKAVGIVATHDLQIAEMEKDHPEYIRNFYFDIQVQGDEMKFDYTLKPGECKTFNASMLLRKLGINI